MDLKVFLILIFVCLKVSAQYYKIEKSDKYSALDIYEVSQKLNIHGFFETDLKRKGHIFKTPIDQMYLHSSNDDKKAILILDLTPNHNEKILKISDTEFVCHAKTKRGRSFSLYIKITEEKEFLSICNYFINIKKPTWSGFNSLKFFQKINLFINTAFASTSTCHELQTSHQKLSPLASTLNDFSIIQRLGTCLSDMMHGSEQTFIGLTDSLQSLLNNPKELWSEISQQANALKNFIVQLKDEVVQLSNLWKDVDSDIIMQLGCQLGGEILTASGAALFTGIGTLKLSTILVQSLLKLKSSSNLLRRLSQIKKNGNENNIREVLSCVAKD